MYSGLQRPRKLLLLGVPAEARAEGHHSPKHRGHDYSRDLTDRILHRPGSRVRDVRRSQMAEERTYTVRIHNQNDEGPVSYTHLTLPTIYSV